MSLDADLAKIPPDTRDILTRHRFDAEQFKRLAGRLAHETAEQNFVKGALRDCAAEVLSDGVEADYLQFNSGFTVTVGAAAETAQSRGAGPPPLAAGASGPIGARSDGCALR